MTTVILIIVCASGALTALFGAAAVWWSNQAAYWHTNFELAVYRDANKPWYLRAVEWVFNRISHNREENK